MIAPLASSGRRANDRCNGSLAGGGSNSEPAAKILSDICRFLEGSFVFQLPDQACAGTYNPVGR
jgi:hypothetical protein